MTDSETLLLFLPGWLGAAEDWEPVMSRLSDSFRVEAFEPSGFGSRIDEGARPWTVDGAVAEVASHVRASGERSVILAGNSVGGTVALACAARNVPGVRAVIAVASAATWRRLDESSQGMEPEAARELATFLRADLPSAVRTLGPQIWANDADQERAGAVLGGFAERVAGLQEPGAAVDIFVDIGASDIRPDLATMKLPALLVYGDRDMVVPEAVRQDLIGRLPRAEVALIPGAGHLALLTYPDAVAAAIAAFAGRLA